MDPITGLIVGAGLGKMIFGDKETTRTVTTVDGKSFTASSKNPDVTIRPERQGDGLVVEKVTRGYFSDSKSSEWIPARQIASDKTNT